VPLSQAAVRALNAGDIVEVTGTIVTARDRAHQCLLSPDAPPEIGPLLKSGVIYHCGPIVRNGSAVSAGPTTSARLDAYEADVIRRFGVRAVMGKGGMGEKTLAVLKERGCVYLSAVGGCGALLAKKIVSVRACFKGKEFGEPESFWVFDVAGFPAIVTMDSSGRSLHAEVEKKTNAR